MIPGDEWSLESETSTLSSRHSVNKVEIGNPPSDVEVLNGKFSNNRKSKEASKLSSSGIVGRVPV